MRTADLRALTALLTLEEACALAQDSTEEQAAAIMRAWYAPRERLAEWLCAVLPPRWIRLGFHAQARARLLARLSSIPPAYPIRPGVNVAFEGYRGCGKTAIGRWWLLHSLVYGHELEATLLDRTPREGHQHSEALHHPSILLEHRARPKADDVAAYASTPMGRLYPGLEWSGSVESWQLHVPPLLGATDDGADPRVVLRGVAGSGAIRGQSSTERPTVVIANDLETIDSARSPLKRATLWNKLETEVMGLGPNDTGLAVVMFGNALLDDDAMDRARANGWTYDRIGIWSGPPPEDRGLVRDLHALFDSFPKGDERAREEAVREAAAPHANALAALTPPTDPALSQLDVLLKWWALGDRSARRVLACDRISKDERTFDLEKVRTHLCRIEAGALIRGDGSRVPLAALDLVIWLDPRTSKNADGNDFAAVVAVAKDPEGRLFTVDADLQRVSGVQQRARVWAMLDACLSRGFLISRVRIGYETNNGSEQAHEEPFATEVTDRRKQGLAALVPEGHRTPSVQAKLDRIETMEAPLHSGRWQIAAHLVDAELWHQLAGCPHAQHDDGPDAMERAGWMHGNAVKRDDFYGRERVEAPSSSPILMPRGFR